MAKDSQVFRGIIQADPGSVFSKGDTSRVQCKVFSTDQWARVASRIRWAAAGRLDR
jgi:hypothetical protein